MWITGIEPWIYVIIKTVSFRGLPVSNRGQVVRIARNNHMQLVWSQDTLPPGYTLMEIGLLPSKYIGAACDDRFSACDGCVIVSTLDLFSRLRKNFVCDERVMES